MPCTTERYQNFLSNYVFYTNSIEFRIHSSKALEKWKNVQAFQLNQLINGKFYFSQTKREILLLNYDIWSKWLYEVENYCIELSGSKENRTTEIHLEFAQVLSDKVCDLFRITVSNNPNKFNKEFTDIWIEQHTNVHTYMLNELKSYSNLSFKTFFRKCVDLITDVMQHSLIEIYELEGLFRTKENKKCIPFLVVNEFNENTYKNGVCLIQERLKIYKKYFVIDEICLKNYSEDAIDCSLVERIEETGTEINYKLSSRFSSPNPESPEDGCKICKVAEHCDSIYYIDNWSKSDKF